MIYKKYEKCTLYHGLMQDELENLADNSVDSIVTDPPYELNFMNKAWDNSGVAFQADTWRHCLRVLKPGGFLLAFGGSRTFHRIACAIEDAGFEIRDTIMWLYGCLSEDTEILTTNGWRGMNTICEGDEIFSLDLRGDQIVKNKVRHLFKYEYDGEMVHIKNANTDQLLTPNHHCIIKDVIRTRAKGNIAYNSYDYWQYQDAWRIRSQRVTLPLAGKYNGVLEVGNLFAELLGWVISEGEYHQTTNAIMITQTSANMPYVSRIRYVLGKLGIKYTEHQRVRKYKDKLKGDSILRLKKEKISKSYTEYKFYIGKESEGVVNKIKELCPEKRLTWRLLDLSLSNKEFLLKGLCMGDGSKAKHTAFGFDSFYQKDYEELEIFQALLHLTAKQGWINYNPPKAQYYCSISSNPNTEVQGKHAKNRFVKYNGKYVWCVETEIGNFMARRNGKVFITGNSGFPKSLNLGIAVESKLQSGSANTKDWRNLDGEKAESGDWGISKNGKEYGYRPTDYNADGHLRLVKPDYKTEEGKRWDGWGSTLKPSFEPVIMARKPCDGTLTDNVLKWGVGGLNIDECRVGKETLKGGTIAKMGGGAEGICNYSIIGAERLPREDTCGRFPANTIFTYDDTDFDEVCGGLPSGGQNGSITKRYDMNNQVYGDYGKCNLWQAYNDSGSAARYFYCAKATTRDRDEGCELLAKKKATSKINKSNGTGEGFDGEQTPIRANTHSCVKPTSLLCYLIRLVTPRGGTILDPFMGSGSTGKAAFYENFDRNADYKFIGVEMTAEYLPIAAARIEFAMNDKRVVETEQPANEQSTDSQVKFDL